MDYEADSRKGVLIDTNILLLLILGSADINQVGRNNRLRKYTPQDLQLVQELIKRSRGPILATPHVLAETDNLARQALNGSLQKKAMVFIRNLIINLEEVPIPSKQAVQDPVYFWLGLTDAGIAQVKTRGCIVLLDDGRLADHLTQTGIKALNFNHLRLEYLPA